MKVRTELLITYATLAIGIGLASPVLAADIYTKAPVAVAPAWWYEGYAEIGARFNVNDPDKTKLGKFYKYEDLRPGVFGNFFAGWHRSGADPLDFSVWGKNVGWDDQAFGLSAAKPGTYYFDLYWDETPHVYSRGAQTTFGPIGGNVLATPCYPGTSGLCNGTGSNGNAAAVVNANSYIFNLGFRRDTAAVKGRWTPDDNWDITADYSHMHRDGTQPLSAITFRGSPGNFGPARASIQMPKPVDDTTQNANLKAEYAGSTPWDKPFTVALGYGVSLYNDNVGCGSVANTVAPTAANCLTFQNPWASTNQDAYPLWNRYGLWPDNQAQSLTVSSGVGLPFNSRYMGTFQYTMMTQDDSFLPSSINPLSTLAVLPRSSLDGDARTILSNNVLHTKITPDLESTLRYRYYDYHSNQSPIDITGNIEYPDTSCGPGTPVTCPGPTTTETAFPVNFNKQNASAQLDYRPWKWLNVGGAYEWERWRHEYADAVDVVTGQEGAFDAITNENAVRGFTDVKLWGWSTWRTSVRYGERRLEGDYINPLNNNNDFRMVNIQDRNSLIAKSSWDIAVTQTITFTPTGGYRLDDYPANGVTTTGITKYESWSAGSDIAWAITPMAALYVSYTHEDGIRQVYNNVSSTTGLAQLFYNTHDLDDTFIVGAKYTAIPDKLFLNASYTYSKGTSKWSTDCGPGGCTTSGTNPAVFPDTHNTNQRVDAWAKYMLDPTILRNAGLFAQAKPYVKARVIWEKNDNDSWQNVEQILATSVDANAVFLGMPNPNYDVVVGMMSFGVKW